MAERILDRTESTNPVRLEKYPMATAGVAGDRFRSHSYAFIQLDQGNQGACALFSETMEAAARPKPFFGDPVRVWVDVSEVEAVARRLYDWARDNDEFAETSSKPGGGEGTSLDAAARAGVKEGFAKGFRWATGTPERMVAQAMEAVAFNGPVKCGSHWRSGMWKADGDGFLRYEGRYEGGHGFVFTRSSKKLDALWTPNSWGGEGQGWIKRSDLVKMAAEGGEFCIAVDRLNRRR